MVTNSNLPKADQLVIYKAWPRSWTQGNWDQINSVSNRVEGLDTWGQITSLVLQPLGHTASTTFNLSMCNFAF